MRQAHHLGHKQLCRCSSSRREPGPPCTGPGRFDFPDCRHRLLLLLSITFLCQIAGPPVGAHRIGLSADRGNALLPWLNRPGTTCTPSASHEQERARMMVAMDSLNQRYGKGTVKVASAGASQRPGNWQMKQARRTPRYTTCWGELAMVRG